MDWNDYTTEELASIYSDYHKDVHGRRSWIDYTDRVAVIEGIESLNRYMAAMKTTAEGRARLRAEGWVVEEPTT